MLILGGSGQLALAFKKISLPGVIFAGRSQVDFLNTSGAIEFLNRVKPKVVVNAVAYTKVDQAESEKEICEKINAETPIEIAKWCAQNDVLFVHYSSDYIFNGSGSKPWPSSGVTKEPLNEYGRSKARAEDGILATGGRNLILRTSWVYSENGHNFVKTMIKLGMQKDELKIVSDQVGAPTYAGDLARATLEMISQVQVNEEKKGIYNVANSGTTSWYEFAKNIFDCARAQGIPLRVQSVTPILTSEYPTPARRPLNSRLDLSELESVFSISMRSYREALADCVAKIEVEL